MRSKRLLGIAVLVFVLLASLHSALSVLPVGPAIENIMVENGSVRPATRLNTSGGTITTVVLNTTTQNPHWKAYVGNVTGKLILEDAGNYSIYEWTITRVAGEVYVTRINNVEWSAIECANSTHISEEETAMNHTAGADDSIANTFSKSTHQGFWTASTEFSPNECNFTLVTYVNDTAQSGSSDFEEILLHDGQAVVYTTLLENKTRGFDLNYYDFQMLVPERGWDGPTSSTAYYFYVEIV